MLPTEARVAPGPHPGRRWWGKGYHLAAHAPQSPYGRAASDDLREGTQIFRSQSPPYCVVDDVEVFLGHTDNLCWGSELSRAERASSRGVAFSLNSSTKLTGIRPTEPMDGRNCCGLATAEYGCLDGPTGSAMQRRQSRLALRTSSGGWTRNESPHATRVFLTRARSFSMQSGRE